MHQNSNLPKNKSLIGTIGLALILVSLPSFLVLAERPQPYQEDREGAERSLAQVQMAMDGSRREQDALPKPVVVPDNQPQKKSVGYWRLVFNNLKVGVETATIPGAILMGVPNKIKDTLNDREEAAVKKVEPGVGFGRILPTMVAWVVASTVAFPLGLALWLAGAILGAALGLGIGLIEALIIKLSQPIQK